MSEEIKISGKLTDFFQQFNHKTVNSQKQSELAELYYSFQNFAAELFSKSAWPSLKEVESVLGEKVNDLFALLYQELIDRHFFSKSLSDPQCEERNMAKFFVNSFANYQKLFDYLIKDCKIDISLQWLWNLVDEYLYQLMAFSEFRRKKSHRSVVEIRILSENMDAWNVSTVLETLENVVEKSGVSLLLTAQRKSRQKKGQRESSVSQIILTEKPEKKVRYVLGYFSMIGLLRVHVYLGDYYNALQSIAPLDLQSNKEFHMKVIASNVTIGYYAGFSYLMLRRYDDASKLYCSVLLHLLRSKSPSFKNYQSQNIAKQAEQMYAMLAVVLSICPQRIDESVNNIVREKHGDKISRFQRGDDSRIGELLRFGMPKFVTTFIPQDYQAEIVESQKKVKNNHQYNQLMMEIKRHSDVIPKIKHYLKVYKTIDLEKLSKFTDLSKEEVCQGLMRLKLKSRQVVHTKDGSAAIEGEWKTYGTDFYVTEKEAITKKRRGPKQWGDYFLKQLQQQ